MSRKDYFVVSFAEGASRYLAGQRFFEGWYFGIRYVKLRERWKHREQESFDHEASFHFDNSGNLQLVPQCMHTKL